MSPRVRLNPAFLISLVLLGGAAVAMDAGIRAYGIYLRKLPIYPPGHRALRSIPAETDLWTRIGADEDASEETLETLGTTNYLTRTYTRRTPEGDRGTPVVQLHAAYYTGMIDTVPHVPERCFTGGGLALSGGPWLVEVPLQTSEWGRHPDATPDEVGHVYSVRISNRQSEAWNQRLRLPRGLTPDRPLQMLISEYTSPAGRKMYAGYFFIANGGWVASANDVRQLAFDLTDDYAFYLKVQFSSAWVASPGELAALSGSLLDGLLGEIMRCVPDWTEVQQGRYPEDNPRRAGSPPGGRS